MTNSICSWLRGLTIQHCENLNLIVGLIPNKLDLLRQYIEAGIYGSGDKLCLELILKAKTIKISDKWTRLGSLRC